MAKKNVTNLKKNLLIVLFAVVAIFVLMILIVPQIPIDAESSQSLIDFVTWFVDLKTHFESNVSLYALVLAVLGSGYYFLVYKPKAK